jgi:hypothetical protein
MSQLWDAIQTLLGLEREIADITAAQIAGRYPDRTSMK